MIESGPFSVPRLMMSLVSVLPSDDDVADTAYWLARTIGEQLILEGNTVISKTSLLAVAHEVITRYDPTAGMQYALKHHLIKTTASPRRGRPKLTRP